MNPFLLVIETIVIVVQFSSITQPCVDALNCSCSCSWLGTTDAMLLRIFDILGPQSTKACSLQINQTDLAKIIDGRQQAVMCNQTSGLILEMDPGTTTITTKNVTTSLALPAPTTIITTDTNSPTTTVAPTLPSWRNQHNFGSLGIASSMAAIHPEAVDNYLQLATNSFSNFSNSERSQSQQQHVMGGSQLPSRQRLNTTEQQRLLSVIVQLFKQQQTLLMPPPLKARADNTNNNTSQETMRGRRRNTGRRSKRQAPPILTPNSKCTASQQTEACRLLELVKAGTLFLMPIIPDDGISSVQNTEASAFANMLDMCAGEKAKTLQLTGVCVDANVLNAIGTFSIKYYGETSMPLTVKSLVGGIFPVLSAGGSASILHRHGVAVDFACGMYESLVPDACLKVLTMCSKRAKQLQLPSLYFSIFAENYGCGSFSSYFDSVHCTLGSVDPKVLVTPP